jgi:hypothetical protein
VTSSRMQPWLAEPMVERLEDRCTSVVAIARSRHAGNDIPVARQRHLGARVEHHRRSAGANASASDSPLVGKRPSVKRSVNRFRGDEQNSHCTRIGAALCRSRASDRPREEERVRMNRSRSFDSSRQRPSYDAVSRRDAARASCFIPIFAQARGWRPDRRRPFHRSRSDARRARRATSAVAGGQWSDAAPCAPGPGAAGPTRRSRLESTITNHTVPIRGVEVA